MKRFILLISFTVFLVSCDTQEKTTSSGAKIVINKKHGINLESGTLQRIDSFPSKNIETRPVDIWLPEGYTKEKKYAVLYMHDGQMLFDSTKTWNKQEWKVDEWASKLQKKGTTKDFIVVAPHNIPKIRWNDYFPAKAMNYVSEEDKSKIQALAKQTNANTYLNADGYLKFLVQELKPYIDKNYSVLTYKENTVISGSSMGGLISMYAISEYPEVFGAAACISTHWPGAGVTDDNPLPEAIFAYMKDHIPSPKDHKLYFDYGNKTLDAYYPQYAPKVDSIYRSSGYSDKNFKNLFFENKDHSENSWNQRLEIPLTFLLAK